MKPEHAQEIYNMLLELAKNHVCEYRNGRFNAGLKRAKKLLGLERPDVPEPGTIVEYERENDNSVLRLGWFCARNAIDGVVVYTVLINGCFSWFERAIKWRYPGEKEWRE